MSRNYSYGKVSSWRINKQLRTGWWLSRSSGVWTIVNKMQKKKKQKKAAGTGGKKQKHEKEGDENCTAAMKKAHVVASMLSATGGGWAAPGGIQQPWSAAISHSVLSASNCFATEVGPGGPQRAQQEVLFFPSSSLCRWIEELQLLCCSVSATTCGLLQK